MDRSYFPSILSDYKPASRHLELHDSHSKTPNAYMAEPLTMEPASAPNDPRRPEALLDAGETTLNIEGPVAVDDFESVCMNRSVWMGELELRIGQDESSQFGGSDSDITSLSSSILDYEYENGRRYHSNRAVGPSASNCEIHADLVIGTIYVMLNLLIGMDDS